MPSAYAGTDIISYFHGVEIYHTATQAANFILQNSKGEWKMSKKRLDFMKDAFRGFELKFAEDESNVVILNPNYDENITVYDDEYEFIACFSFQHRHFEDEEDIIEWIGKIISGNTFAIEFFNNNQRCFGSEIDTEELQGLTYKKLEQFTGYYGLTKLLDVVDSFKIRSWDGKNNFDYTMICEENGNVVINQIFVGIL